MPDDSGREFFPEHFDGRRFYNPGAPQAAGLIDVLRWKLTSRPDRSPDFVDDVTASIPPARVSGYDVRVTLVNHSTVLLQFNEVNILTDPIWSQRASPVSWAGPKRRRAPGIRQADLPEIDIVLLSHNHYDHLDLSTLKWLFEHGHSTFIAPLGVGRLLRSRGFEPMHELDWGDSKRLDALTIHSVPAYHFSARGMFDRNKTLWCGYVIESGSTRIYFAGDTAFGPHFTWIHDRFGSPALALLPIGAYKPRWFMSPVHGSPDEALRAREILGARASVAIHHGTFQLTDEDIDAPARELVSCGAPESFVVLRNGESRVFGAG